MSNQRGFSLLELLIVLVMLTLTILLVAFSVIGQIDEARGKTLVSQARAVHVAAQAVILESKAAAEVIEDEEYMAGLTGTVNRVTQPVQTQLSQRMNTLLAPDVILSDTPSEEAACVSFVVRDGAIESMTYEALLNGRHYAVTIADGETTVERIAND